MDFSSALQRTDRGGVGVGIDRGQYVVQNAADNGCLVEMTEAAQAQGGEKPERVLADAGYRSEENFRKLAEKKITAYVAAGRKAREQRHFAEHEKSAHASDAGAVAK